MNFDTTGSIAGYARASVTLRKRMVQYHRTQAAQNYLKMFLAPRTAPGGKATPQTLATIHAMSSRPWQHGDPYVIAPAMTAIVAAATAALDLSGEVLPADIAPDGAAAGIVFLPEPIYYRNISGAVTSIGAVTWARYHGQGDAVSGWGICGWADRYDPHDPSAAHTRVLLAKRPDLAKKLGPYLLADFAIVPIGHPIVANADLPVIDSAEREWQPAPDGRYCLDETTAPTRVLAAFLYAFWAISAQPIATVTTAPTGTSPSTRPHRASIRHETRVVMLRRTKPVTDPTDGEPKWRYRVRFIVRGHWRRLIDRDGNPYRIWINAHIKGPDGAPLLHGEKVAVLGR